MTKKDDNAKAPKKGAGHERIWNSPIGAGEPIPFDPKKHKPGLSKEEIEKLLKD